MEQPVFEPCHRAEFRLAQGRRARDDGLEYRLDVVWRARDHAQDLAGRGLLRQRLVALGRALVELAPERGNSLSQIGRRVVERCHAVASPIRQCPCLAVHTY